MPALLSIMWIVNTLTTLVMSKSIMMIPSLAAKVDRTDEMRLANLEVQVKLLNRRIRNFENFGESENHRMFSRKTSISRKNQFFEKC